jgi:hypothetical protein
MSDATAFRCPHCKTELPEKASFCAACGRRIEGWSVPASATPAMGEPLLPGGEERTRQMEPTPSLLRAAAISVKKGGAGRRKPTPRSPVPLVIGMVVVAAAGGVGGFFLVRGRMRRTREKPPLVAVVPTTTGPMLVTSPEPPKEEAPPPPAPSQMLVRKSKTGKKAHVIASVPVPVAEPAGKKARVVKGGGGGLPHKAVVTDSKSLSAQQAAAATAAAPATMPTAEHETTSETKPSTEAEQKQEAEAQLDADSVRLVVRQHLPQVRACYARAFKDASPGGTVEIGFAIDASGRAKNVRTETNTTDSEPVAHCLEQRVKEWQFPRPVGGDYELIYPFVFAPGS